MNLARSLERNGKITSLKKDVNANEEKQIQMEDRFDDERLRFFLGDVNDYERLKRALEDIDIVYHTTGSVVPLFIEQMTKKL